MALTLGDAPFGPRRNGIFNFDTGVLKPHTLYFEDCPRRVRTVFNGETIADSRHMKQLHETGHLPVYYFPEGDVHMRWLEKSTHTSHCPFKGDAAYWSIQVGERRADNAVWTYPEPLPDSPSLAGYLAFYWDKMDAWYEEDERVSVHPRDPYHRVDVLDSTRHVRVAINGETVAETRRPRLLFETSLPTRYYIPREDVRTQLLIPSRTRTECPYKGVASYWSARIGDGEVADVAWEYPQPLPEAVKLPGTLCFLGASVEIEVDGEKQV